MHRQRFPKAVLSVMLLAGACGTPKAAFRWGHTPPLVAQQPRPAAGGAIVSPPLAALTTQVNPERTPGVTHRPLPLARRSAALVSRPVATKPKTAETVSFKGQSRSFGRHARQQPSGGFKGPIWPILLALAALLLAAVALVGLLVAAVAGAAALPWLVTLGVAGGLFLLAALSR